MKMDGKCRCIYLGVESLARAHRYDARRDLVASLRVAAAVGERKSAASDRHRDQ